MNDAVISKLSVKCTFTLKCVAEKERECVCICFLQIGSRIVNKCIALETVIKH